MVRTASGWKIAGLVYSLDLNPAPPVDGAQSQQVIRPGLGEHAWQHY